MIWLLSHPSTPPISNSTGDTHSKVLKYPTIFPSKNAELYADFKFVDADFLKNVPKKEVAE
jgi:hypothetical protein